MPEPTTRILVFAKEPVPGQCKTRLIPALGENGAARLHAWCIEHTLGIVQTCLDSVVELWVTPNDLHPMLRRYATRFGVALHRQSDGDIGQRMQHALQDALTRAPHALLVGTDCPALEPADLMHATSALQQGHDAVLLPVEDGGYTLIGLRRAAHEVFEDIAWSTSEVLTQTRARLRALGWRWTELPTRWDVDRPEDLERLWRARPELARVFACVA